MNLINLIEAMKRNLYGALQNKEVYKSGDDTFIIQLSDHLHDERPDHNDLARGDTLMPKEIKTAIRLGLKKLLMKYTIDELIKEKASFEIATKIKKKLVRINNRTGKKEKIQLYTSIIIACTRMRFMKNKIRVKVITIYRPELFIGNKSTKATYQVKV